MLNFLFNVICKINFNIFFVLYMFAQGVVVIWVYLASFKKKKKLNPWI